MRTEARHSALALIPSKGSALSPQSSALSPQPYLPLSLAVQAVDGVLSERRDKGEVPVPLPVVEAVADHEPVGDLEAPVGDRQVRDPARRLVESDGGFGGGR